MDHHSEMEAKFEADGLSVAQVQEFVDDLPNRGYWKCRQYRKADGIDTFFRVGAGVFRSRHDNITIDRLYAPFIGDHADHVDLHPSIYRALTVKQRKSADSIIDRKEVDLLLGDGQKPEDVAAFAKLLGGSEEFRIHKVYDIWNLRIAGWGQNPGAQPHLVDLGVEVCLALYDSFRPDGSDRRRFLEIEIEKHSECGSAEGRVTLEGWIKNLKKAFELTDPVNTSLLELYSPPASGT